MSKTGEVKVTLEHFKRLVTVVQDCAAPIIGSGEQHAPMILGARVRSGRLDVLPPVMIPNRSKSDLVIAREVINAMLSARHVDVGIFICESWMAELNSKAEYETLQRTGLKGSGKESSTLIIMLYSRGEEHCVLNPIVEGPPRRLTRGSLDEIQRFGGRLSLHAGDEEVSAGDLGLT